MTGQWVTPPDPAALTGAEPVVGTDATVRDFWSWSLSDLRSNTARGLLAEYLVARAVGAAARPRIEWDACDVVIAQGRIEVKSAAYLQAWAQIKPSRISFGGLRARTWSPQQGYGLEASYNADVYVFAVLAATDYDHYNALDTAGWRFWVLSASVVAATGQKSMGLRRVETLAGASVTYEQLGETVVAVLAAENAPV